MDFGFDAEKSESNRDKHAIDFNEAQDLWQDVRSLVVPAKSSNKPRYALVAKLGGKHWVAFHTMRGNAVRIISFGASATRGSSVTKTISAEELDRKFGDGEDISECLDWSKA
jgi:uncharacterized DUF497 family protein